MAGNHKFGENLKCIYWLDFEQKRCKATLGEHEGLYKGLVSIIQYWHNLGLYLKYSLLLPSKRQIWTNFGYCSYLVQPYLGAGLKSKRQLDFLT